MELIKSLTPEESLKMIDGVLAEVNTNRAGHIRLSEAVNVLRNTVNQFNELTNKKENKQDK